jgi:methyltransferase OMS1, mitochondrial
MSSSASATALRHAVAAVGGGLVATSTAFYTYHSIRGERDFAALQADHPPDFSFVDDPKRNHTYDCCAPRYDAILDRDEWFMGVTNLRRRLLHSHARGNVLEVAAGTGRNVPYYATTRATRILLADASAAMLQQARNKVAAIVIETTASKTTQQRRRPPPRFAFLVGDTSHLDQLPDGAFDTVVDTFGLCSYDDPVQALNEMGRLCHKDHGRILLLEHGRSPTWSMVTKYLDRNAEYHAARFGCVWNRDLDAILAASNLHVETLERHHFGTTYYVVCRPPPAPRAASPTLSTSSVGHDDNDDVAARVAKTEEEEKRDHL